MKQIRELEVVCKTFDHLHGTITLNSPLNFDSSMKNVFLLYNEQNQMVSALSVFMPTKQEAEISGYTLPEFRQRGYFQRLLKEALNELRKYSPIDLLFICEPQSSSGKEVIKKNRAYLDFTEYTMRFNGLIKDFPRRHGMEMKLLQAKDEDLESIIAVSQQAFHEEYEDAKSMISKTLDSENRTQYFATYHDQVIGIGSVLFKENEAVVFGLGISESEQGKGFGKELLLLILNEIYNRGVQNISLEVNSRNHRAFSLYSKFGFDVVSSFDYYRKTI